VAWLRNSAPATVVGLAAIVLVGAYGSPFVLTAASLTLLGIVLGSAMNLVMGYAGLINFGIGAFYGIGAYATAIITVRHHMSMWLGVLVGLALAGAIAAVSAFERPKHLGLGPFSVDLSSLEATYLCIALVTVLTLVGIGIMGHRRFGRVLIAIREDELLVRSAGFNVLGFKTLAYVASAMVAALAGSLYLLLIQYVSPAPFTFLTASFEAFVVVAVGGGGTVSGPVVGAVLLVGAPAFLEFSPFVNQLVYGIALLVVVVTLRHGIVPEVVSRWKQLWRRKQPVAWSDEVRGEQAVTT
jgi:branched-chain amino acid transport system permease protein